MSLERILGVLLLKLLIKVLLKLLMGMLLELLLEITLVRLVLMGLLGRLKQPFGSIEKISITTSLSWPSNLSLSLPATMGRVVVP